MLAAALKLALLAALAVTTLGIFPDRVRGSVLAIGTCVAGAVILRFAG